MELPPPYEDSHLFRLEGNITEFNQQISVTLNITNTLSNFTGQGSIGQNKVTCRGSLLGLQFQMVVALYGLEYEYKGKYDAKLKSIKGEFGIKDTIAEKDKFHLLLIS